MINILNNTRKHTRFNVVGNNLVKLELSLDSGEKLMLNALMLDSSAGGLQVLLISYFPLQLQQLLRVDFDEFVSLNGQIIWIKPLEDCIVKVGIEYID